MALAPTPSFEPKPSAAVNGLNAVAAATLWGALLGPYLYPLGASLGLWQSLSRASSSCGDDPADFTMTGAGALVGLALGAVIIGLQLRYGRGRAGIVRVGGKRQQHGERGTGNGMFAMGDVPGSFHVV